MNDVPPVKEPVAVLTLRKVKPEFQEDFEIALHEFISASFKTEGQFGVHVIRPAPGAPSLEYGILRRFADAAARDRFYASPFFTEWEEMIEPMLEGRAVRQHMSGLETWFTLPGERVIIPPPRWKMAVVTLVAVYPVSLLVPWLLHPLIGGLHPLLQAFFIAIGIVALLTWAVMPLLAKVLRPWLHPREETRS